MTQSSQYPERLIEEADRLVDAVHPPIRLELSLTDFQILAAHGVTTHRVRPQAVQITLTPSTTFDQMYDAIETAQEMQGQVGNQQKSDTVIAKLFEVIERMERALVQATAQIESFGNMITDLEARGHVRNLIELNKGKLRSVEELVDQLRMIIRPNDSSDEFDHVS